MIFPNIKPKKIAKGKEAALGSMSFAEINPAQKGQDPSEIEPGMEFADINPSRKSKTPLVMPRFGGINQQHTRQISEPSAGKNFIIVEQKFSTRDGTEIVSGTSFASGLTSIHSAGHANASTHLLVEEGQNLWKREKQGEAWTNIKSDVSGNGFNSTPWSDIFSNGLLLINGTQKLIYDTSTGTLSDVINNCTITTETIHSASETLSEDGVLARSAIWPQGESVPVSVVLPLGTVIPSGATYHGSVTSAALTLSASETLSVGTILPCAFTLPLDTILPSGTVLPVSVTTDKQDPVVVPSMEYATVWNGRIYTWAPNFDEGNLLRPCGLDDDYNISLDYWPPDIAINPSSDSTEPVLAACPVQSHLYILTNKGNYRLYGNTPENWECHASGNIGAYSPNTVSVVSGMVIWLGVSDSTKTIYSYTGSSEVNIGGPIEGLLQEQVYDEVRSYSLGNQFWLVFPSSGQTNVFVFDTKERAWYYFEYPYKINAACMYGSYLSVPGIYFGLDEKTIARVNSSLDTDDGEDIETECTIGPFKLPDNRKFKTKSFWITAEPENLFSLEVYGTVDGGMETDIGIMDFEEGPAGFFVDTQRIRMEGMEGHNITIRMATTDRVKSLQSGSITVEPRGIK